MNLITKKILIFTLLIGLVSCNNEQIDNISPQNETQKNFSFEKNNIKIDYTGEIIDNHLLIDFKINNDVKESFNVNLNKLSFPEDISNQITKKQKRLSKEYSLSEINSLVSIMDEMIISKTENINGKDLRDMKVQGLFICNSLIKSINRLVRHNDIQNYRRDGDVQTTNTVYEGFNRELSSFSLDEDIQVNVQDYITYIEQNPELSQEKGFTFVKVILENKTSSTISLTELQNEILQFTIDNPNMFEGEADPSTGYRWPSGSSHGCCGNYSGPCYFWHPVCWVHDKMCSDCSPSWFCLSGCVPD